MYLSFTFGITRHILHDCVHKVWKNDENRKLFNTSLNFDEINQNKERNVTACRPIAKRHQTDTLENPFYSGGYMSKGPTTLLHWSIY